MNNSEAQELYSESVFSDYNIELRENFRNLKLQLTNNGVITWVNYYKSDSTQWQPFNSDSRNITQLINEVIEQV